EMAESFPAIEFEEMQLDEMAMWLVWEPREMDVLLLPNLYGDIISDICAGLVGGLGLAAGVNLGKDCAVFEATHGSAPDIAGKGIANPTAMMLSGVMLLHHLGEHDAATRLENVIAQILEEGTSTTRDLGGKASTNEFTQTVVRRLGRHT
ncbi:MAG: isocitrate/isopropylmalate family dehydrogenase, partial [Actinomycetota bacterium]